MSDSTTAWVVVLVRPWLERAARTALRAFDDTLAKFVDWFVTEEAGVGGTELPA